MQWAALVKTALLGTERTPLPPLPAVSPLTTLLAQLPAQAPAAALLSRAATADLYEHAGQQPGQSPVPIPTAPFDPRPACGAALTTRLTAMLDGQHPRLLAEFLQGLARIGHRAPAHLLPILLNKGVRVAHLRPFILPVIGAHGRWLAEQRPEWQYAALSPTQISANSDLWRQAPLKQRQGLLRQLRRSAPDQARTLLETTWRSESDAVRNQLIGLLETNISMADEPFLENALDDRHHLVRRRAARLLSYLPDSRLCQRMTAAIRNRLTWQPGDPATIIVQFPQQISTGMVRDGVPAKAAIAPAKLRRRQLLHILSAVPLDHWTATWQTTPNNIAHAILHSPWQHTLRTAFTTAVHRQRRADWAYALLTAHGVSDQNGRLVSVLKEEDCIRLIRSVSDNLTQFPTLERGAPLYVILNKWAQPWPAETAVYYLRLFAAHIRRQEKKAMPDPSLRLMMQQFARRCPPQLRAAAAGILPDAANHHPTWQRTTLDLLDLLTFRQEMWQELEQ